MLELGALCKRFLNVPLKVCNVVLSKAAQGGRTKHSQVSLDTPESYCIQLNLFIFLPVVLASSQLPGKINCIRPPLPSTWCTTKICLQRPSKRT